MNTVNGMKLDISWCLSGLFKILSRLLIISLPVMFHSQLHAEIYLSEDFESGNLDKFFVWTPDTVSIRRNVGGNPSSALKIVYDMPSGGDPHKDLGLYVYKDVAKHNLDHLFVKGSFYSAPTDMPTNARKFIYITSGPWEEPKWDAMLSLRGGKNGRPICMNWGSNAYDYSDLTIQEWELACGKIKYGEWHTVEVELKINSVGNRDGWARIWLDGNLEYERTGIRVRKDSKPFGAVYFGMQIDRQGDDLPRYEERYWDDLVISSTYTGSDPSYQTNSPPRPPALIQ